MKLFGFNSVSFFSYAFQAIMSALITPTESYELAMDGQEILAMDGAFIQTMNSI